MHRLEERELYVIWILLNWKRLRPKDCMSFDDLTALGSSELLTVSILNNFLKSFPVKITNLELVRGKYAFDGFCSTEIDKNTKFAEEKPQSALSKSIKNLYSGKFSFDDVLHVLSMTKNCKK